jgi:hypothetical protein
VKPGSLIADKTLMLCIPGIDAALIFLHAVQTDDPVILYAVTRGEIPDGRRAELLVIEFDLDGNQGVCNKFNLDEGPLFFKLNFPHRTH